MLRKEKRGHESGMAHQSEELGVLFESQVKRLNESHFMVLYWAAQSEGKGVKYNITNMFDDMKATGLTRTKQTAVSVVSALVALCFLDLREESNRKNIYITRFGAKALETMVLNDSYKPRQSAYLEERQA